MLLPVVSPDHRSLRGLASLNLLPFPFFGVSAACSCYSVMDCELHICTSADVVSGQTDVAAHKPTDAATFDLRDLLDR